MQESLKNYNFLIFLADVTAIVGLSDMTPTSLAAPVVPRTGLQR